MEKVISATEARIHFGDLLRRVAEEGEAVIVERSGVPQVAVVSLADYERLQAMSGTDQTRSALEQASRVAARIAERRGDYTLTHPADIIHEGREERNAHYPDLR